MRITDTPSKATKTQDDRTHLFLEPIRKEGRFKLAIFVIARPAVYAGRSNLLFCSWDRWSRFFYHRMYPIPGPSLTSPCHCEGASFATETISSFHLPVAGTVGPGFIMLPGIRGNSFPEQSGVYVIYIICHLVPVRVCETCGLSRSKQSPPIITLYLSEYFQSWMEAHRPLKQSNLSV